MTNTDTVSDFYNLDATTGEATSNYVAVYWGDPAPAYRPPAAPANPGASVAYVAKAFSRGQNAWRSFLGNLLLPNDLHPATEYVQIVERGSEARGTRVTDERGHYTHAGTTTGYSLQDADHAERESEAHGKQDNSR